MATRRTAKKAKPRAKTRAPRPKAAARRSTTPPARRIPIDTEWTWDDIYPLAQGIRFGQMIFVSGQVALDPEGHLVGPGDIKAQTHQAFRNVEAVLARAGAALRDIVKITSYLTDESTFQQMLEARREIFGGDPPASTAVVVRRLALPELMIEVEAIAIKP